MALRTGAEIDRASPSGSYLAGRFALEHGNVAAAAEEFASALNADPENLELFRQVFVLRLASGDLDGARAIAEQLVELDPSADEAWLLLGVEHLASGDPAQAQSAFQEVGPRGVPGVLAPMLGAWSLYGQGQGEAALELMPVGKREDGFGPLYIYHRAAMLRLLGRKDEARSMIAELVQDSRPIADRVVITAVILAAEAGDWQRANELLEQQIALRGGSLPLARALQEVRAQRVPEAPIRDADTGAADAIYGLAGLLYEQRIVAQALIYGQLASFLTPEAGDVRFLLGEAALAQENPEDAITSFEAVPPASPYAWDAGLGKAEALDGMGRKEEATALLRRMAEEHPERIETLVKLADWLRRDEKFAEADAVYTEALDRIGELEREDWRLLYARGIARERIGNWGGAEADFLKALELEPDQPYVLNYLGYSWVDQGANLDRAKAMLHKAVELRPDDGFIVDSLGWAYYRLGEYGQAVEYLERAAELEPADPTINDHLGDAYWRVGRLREARFQWQRALTFKPEQDDIAQIEHKLENGLAEGRAGPG
jgi:Flp pilus assembly protein TadD